MSMLNPKFNLFGLEFILFALCKIKFIFAQGDIFESVKEENDSAKIQSVSSSHELKPSWISENV